MTEDFEKGKELIIKGIEGIIELAEPLLEMLQGFKMIKVWELVTQDQTKIDEHMKLYKSLEDFETIKIIAQSWLGDLKKATTREEVKQTLDRARDLWGMLRE